MQITVLIPTLNEAMVIGRTLQRIRDLQPHVDMLVVDGCSTDHTREIAQSHGAQVVLGFGGRGASLRTAADKASGEALWFLHADTLPPLDGAAKIAEALRDPDVVGGNFGIKFDSTGRDARFLTWLYPYLRYIGLIYGDSGIFVRREAYERVGGLRPYPVFEDVDLIRRLRDIGRLVRIPSCVITSSRRFHNRNFGLVFLKWFLLTVGYWLGVNPVVLGKWYPPRYHKDS